MAGGNLAAGSVMVLAVVIITSLVAFIKLDGGITPSGEDVGCDTNGNATTCDGGSPQSFLDAFFDVSVSGFSGVAIVDGLYVLIMAGVLVIGLALIVAGIIGIPLGGG